MSQGGERSKFKRRIRLILLVCVALYIVSGIGCALFQRRFIYFSHVYTSEQVDADAKQANLERWRSPSGSYVGMKRPSAKQPAEGQVLIMYGGGTDALGCAGLANVMQQAAAFDVFILEYPGYNDRPGSPNQESLFRAADEGFQLLAMNGPVYLVGISLGTGVASYLAGTYPYKVAGVLLFAPFNCMADVAQYHVPTLPVRLFLTERFPSEDYLRNYRGPVGILVAGRDALVPQRFGRRLFDGYAGPKKLWEFPPDTHYTVTERPPEFWKQVIEFWQINPQI